MLRILISNDDGIEAAGLAALEEIARSISDDVWVCAPASEASGAGHSITVHRPLRIRTFGPKRYAIDGTPTDCVLVAVNDLMADRKPDLVLSGINHGVNIGDDVTYSGTIGAAMEGCLQGIRSIAFSLELNDGKPARWDAAVHWGKVVVPKLLTLPFQPETLTNVNFPDRDIADTAGVAVLRHGTWKIGDQITHHLDPRGRRYTWIGPARRHGIEPGLEHDVTALHAGYVTVTPIQMDMTCYPLLDRMKEVFV